MSKPAAITAVLVDIRNIGTDKCIKLTLHVSAERAAEVLAAFGWPTNVDPVPVALARLQQQSDAAANLPPAAPPREAAATTMGAASRRPFATLPLPQQAGLLCNDPIFSAFLNEEFHAGVESADAAAAYLRRLCDIKSRSELRPDNSGGGKFVVVREQFMAWRLVAA